MESFIGSMIMFGGNFAPRGWALCDGQLLPISQNQALFSILGTTFGGDGRTTFALPDMRSRVGVHPGTGPGLSHYNLGQRGGEEHVALTTNQIPGHTHSVACSSERGDNAVPDGDFFAGGKPGDQELYAATSDNNDMNTAMIANDGGGNPHTNIEPFECPNYIIALVGVFPSRN